MLESNTFRSILEDTAQNGAAIKPWSLFHWAKV